MALAYGYNECGEIAAGGWFRHADVQIYRYGYQVGSAKPRLVGESKDRDEAVREAKLAAAQAVEKLMEIGAPADVSWWVQDGQTTTRTEWSDPEIEAV